MTHLAPQVLAGQGVAQRAFVGAPAAARAGRSPKSRHNCLRHKELEKVSMVGAVEKEFRASKKVFREARRDRVCLWNAVACRRFSLRPRLSGLARFETAGQPVIFLFTPRKVGRGNHESNE